MNKRAYGSKGVAMAIAATFFLGQTTAAWAQAHGAEKPAAAAKAADEKAELTAAKKHYAEGEKKFKAGDFAGALVEFNAANDIKPTPHAERYIGLSEDSLGHYAAAVDWYDKFLAHVPEKLASQGDEIRKREGEIKAMPGKVHVDSTPAGAAVTVDDKPQASPTPLDVDLAPGPHVLKLTATGRNPATKNVDVAFASSQTVSVELEEAPPPPPAPVAAAAPAPAPAAPTPPPPVMPSQEPRSIVPAVVMGGLAIAAAGVGAVFGVLALSDKNKFNNNPTTSTADSGDTHALVSDMSFGVALTFGITSAVLFFTKDEPATATSSSGAGPGVAQTTVTAAPFVGPHEGGGSVLVRF